jgi:hypothetical protein
MTKKLRIVEGKGAAAAILGVPVATLKAAQNAGAPGFRPGSRVEIETVRKWLAEQGKRAGKARPARKNTAPNASDAQGAPGSLRRLESQERECYQRLLAAQKSGNALEESLAREAWLEVTEALRKLDISVAEARRDSGESVPRADAERALNRAAWLLSVVIPEISRRLARAIGPEARIPEITEATTAALRSLVFDAIGLACGSCPLPKWAVESLRKGAALTPLAGEMPFAPWHGEVGSALFGNLAEEDFNAAMARFRERETARKTHLEALAPKDGTLKSQKSTTSK